MGNQGHLLPKIASNKWSDEGIFPLNENDENVSNSERRRKFHRGNFQQEAVKCTCREASQAPHPTFYFKRCLSFMHIFTDNMFHVRVAFFRVNQRDRMKLNLQRYWIFCSFRKWSELMSGCQKQKSSRSFLQASQLINKVYYIRCSLFHIIFRISIPSSRLFLTFLFVWHYQIFYYWLLCHLRNEISLFFLLQWRQSDEHNHNRWRCARGCRVWMKRAFKKPSTDTCNNY